MDVKSLLESLDRARSLDYLLTLIPIVGPGAIISNNLEWSSKFSQGQMLYHSGNYETAREVFRELDDALPGHDRILTPAKINECICWLQLGKFEDYVAKYEPFLKQNRARGVVLWNLAIAYYRMGKPSNAEFCLRKWTESPVTPFLGKAHLLISLLQVHNKKTDDAINSFYEAWKADKDYCIRIITKHLSPEASKILLGVETPIAPLGDKEYEVVAKEEVMSSLQGLLIPRGPSKYPQIAQQLSEFEYRSGYIPTIEKFADGDVDGALKLIESLLKGAREKAPLLWAKAACLAVRREWRASIDLVEDQLNDQGMPGGVLWNATCACFNLGKYDLALDTVSKCTEREYRSSSMAWLAQGLLAHLCGKIALRNNVIKEAIKRSPRELVHHLSTLKQIGVELEGIPADDRLQALGVEDDRVVAKYAEITVRARDLLKQGKAIQAAQEFGQLSPRNVGEIPEIDDKTFKPVILPTCSAKLYDYKEIFLSGTAAFQRRAYEEAIQKFEDLYVKTDRSYPAAVNLSASLIMAERYSRAIDILIDSIRQREHSGAHAIRNLISAFMRSDRSEDAFAWFSKLLEASTKEYFNFVQMAYVAQLLGRKEDVATALYNACTMTLSEPSLRLRAAAISACLEVKDNDRADALVMYFVKEKPLPYLVAGVTRPIMPARDCKGYLQMKRQYDRFELSRDARAALAYFEEVHSAREADYSSEVQPETVDGLFNGCMFYGRSLFWNEEFDKAHEILRQALSVLIEHPDYWQLRELSKRYYALTNVYFQRKHYFWALELCERGLEGDSNNNTLLTLHKEIKQRIEEIPETSREAMKHLAELPLSTVQNTGEFLGLLPKVTQLIRALPQDFPASREVVINLGNLINASLSLESVTVINRKKQIVRQREIASQIDRDLPLYLPRAFISALLPLVKGIRKALDEIQEKSICPEFTFVLESTSYYRESEASLVYKLRNIGSADIIKLRTKIESESPQKWWVPVLEEQSFEIVKKDELLWVDWPIHLDYQPDSEAEIKPKVTLRFTGGSLRGELVEQTMTDQGTKLLPFVDISVDYPVVALKPEENTKLNGRENLLRTLKNSFTRSGQTRIPFLEGVRKVGKTSILYFLAARISDDRAIFKRCANRGKAVYPLG